MTKDSKHSEVIELARVLKLNPRQSPDEPPHIWYINCPCTPHYLLVDVSIDKFYCGYCKRGGGPSSLRDFVEERREADERRRQEFSAKEIRRAANSLAEWGRGSIGA